MDNRYRKRTAGTVLLIVVVIVMLLSLVAYQFLLSMQTEHMATAIYGDQLQARLSAESAQDLFKMLLEKSRSERAMFGGLTDNPALFAGSTKTLEGLGSTSIDLATSSEQPPFGLIAYGLSTVDNPSAMEGIRASFSPTDSAQDASASAGVSLATGQANALYPPTRYGAINESQKLHLWKLLQWDSESPGAGEDSLMMLPGMDQATAAAIMDWLDADDEPRDQGAESQYYAQLTRPIAPRNGMPFEMDELLFIKGVTPWQLLGTKANSFNAAISSLANGASTNSLSSTFDVGSNTFEQATQQPGSSMAMDDPLSAPAPWSDFLTVYSAERNESFTGARRVYVNRSNLAELHGDLTEGLSQAWADYIVLYRQYGPTKSGSSLSNENSAPNSVKMNFETKPEFSIENLLELVGSRVTVPSEDEGQDPIIYPSPAQFDNLSAANLEVVFDQLTTSPQRRILGRINIDLADPAVLATLPTMTGEIIQQIISAREGNRDREQPRIHPVWLLVENVVEPEVMRALLPNITCGGDVFKAEVWGRDQDGRATYRFETILDGSQKKCRAVYYRELAAENERIKILTEEEIAALGMTTAPTLEAFNQSGDE